MSFPKIVNQMGSFWWKKKKNLRFCRPILDIFGFTLLNTDLLLKKKNWDLERVHCKYFYIDYR